MNSHCIHRFGSMINNLCFVIVIDGDKRAKCNWNQIWPTLPLQLNIVRRMLAKSDVYFIFPKQEVNEENRMRLDIRTNVFLCLVSSITNLVSSSNSNDMNVNTSLERRLNQNDIYKMSDYSSKFIRCQSIKSYSSDDSNTFVFNEDYIIVRLCPMTGCNSNFYFGCSSNFVDYLLRLSDYLEILQNRQQWCKECKRCSTDDNKLNYTGYQNDCNRFSQNCTKLCDEQNIDYDDFRCRKSNATDSSGQSFYVGPTCSTDYTGIVMTSFYDEDCKIPKENLLGKPGEGFKIAMVYLYNILILLSWL